MSAKFFLKIKRMKLCGHALIFRLLIETFYPDAANMPPWLPSCY